jgi:hypothetical protein
MRFSRRAFFESHHSTQQSVMHLLVTSAPKSNLAMPALDVLNNAVALLEAGIEGGNLSENMVSCAS